MTLDDLERPKRTLAKTRFRDHHHNVNEDRQNAVSDKI